MFKMSQRLIGKNNKSVVAFDSRPVAPVINVLFVCALNIGETYSRYAYSTRYDPKNILCPYWTSSSASTVDKTPTVLLLDEKQNFIAFGYEAEEKFFELDEEERKECYYFQGFQIYLYDKHRSGERLSTGMKVSDCTGKELHAEVIFSHAIKYLKDHMLNETRRIFLELEDVSIYWVLSVPALWSDPKKKLMIQAAEKAGIDKKRLDIVLTSEAAFFFCKEFPLEKYEYESDDIDVLFPGQRCLVLNAEDRTIDMTVLEVRPGGKLHILSQESWGDCSGIMVDNTFKQMLIDIVGEKFMDSYCQNNAADYIELIRRFEMKKYEKLYKIHLTEIVTLSFPPTFFEKYNEKMGKNISQRVKETRYAKMLKWVKNKMRIDKDLFQSFFNPSCEMIVHYIGHILSRPEVKGSKIILMVGCFSELAMLQDAVKKAFPEYRIVVPHQARLAVLKGAVLFGHNIIRRQRSAIENKGNN